MNISTIEVLVKTCKYVHWIKHLYIIISEQSLMNWLTARGYSDQFVRILFFILHCCCYV